MTALRQTHRFDVLEVEVDDHIVEKFPLVKPSTVALGYFKCTLALRRIRRPYGEPADPLKTATRAMEMSVPRVIRRKEKRQTLRLIRLFIGQMMLRSAGSHRCRAAGR